jgi:hypothetical protein
MDDGEPSCAAVIGDCHDFQFETAVIDPYKCQRVTVHGRFSSILHRRDNVRDADSMLPRRSRDPDIHRPNIEYMLGLSISTGKVIHRRCHPQAAALDGLVLEVDEDIRGCRRNHLPVVPLRHPMTTTGIGKPAAVSPLSAAR